VYIGAQAFSARAEATNSVEDIKRLTDFAHLYGAKVYVAFNTILYEDELEDARRLVEALANVGIDALITQDTA
jgi:putative protease